MNSPVIVRMPPSPTGLFHVGSARTALYNWLFARHHRGKFILRIEDTDQERCLPEAVDSILEALTWLGLCWDEGPYFQSQRLPLYQQAARELLEKGFAYPCYCTPEELAERRQQMQAAGRPPKYDGRCRRLSEKQKADFIAEGRTPALRFPTPQEGATIFADHIRGAVEFENSLLDDFVIQRSNGSPTYLLANVVDDAAMGVTHIIRGEDLISGTPRQILLYQALGKLLPEFAHLPLLLGPDRSKLSKRHGALPVMAYRDQGYLPEAMINFLALLGWSPGDNKEIFTLPELVEAFSLPGVGKSGAIFDVEKLKWMNGNYLRSLSLEELTAKARPFMPLAEVEEIDDCYLARVMALEQERAKTLAELPELTSFFFTEAYEIEEKAAAKWLTPDSRTLLAEFAARLEKLEDFCRDSIEKPLRELAEEKGLKASALIHPTRVALSGRTAGPGLFEMMEVLGKARVIARLRRAAPL
jgi:glutamyl-tRNA synthetase